MARAGETNLGTQGDLFLGQIGTQGFYAHSDLRWVGVMASSGTTATGGASTDPNAPSVLYREGDAVVHNNRIFISLGNSDNVVPGLETGSVLRAASTGVTAIVANTAQIAASVAAWEEIGNDDVLGAREYSNTSSYEVNNLVYDNNGGLFAVRMPIAASATARPSSMDPFQQPTLYRRVGGAPTTIQQSLLTFGVTADISSNVLRLTFADATTKLNFVRHFLSNSEYTQTQLDARTAITNRADLVFATLNNGAAAAALLAPPSNMDIRFNLTLADGSDPILLRHYFQYDTNNNNGGPFYNGAANSIFIPNYNAGTGTFTNHVRITTSMYEGEITDGVRYIEGNHINFDLNGDGTEVTISADQRAITASAPLMYDSNSGNIIFRSNSNEFTTTGDQLNLHIDETPRTGGTRNDTGSGLEVNADGLRVEIDDTTHNVIEATSSGLFVGDQVLSTAAGATNTAVLRTTTHEQGNTTDTSDIIIEGNNAAPSAAASVSNSVTVSRETSGNIRITGVPVASWAQTQSGTDANSVMIPANKLPNLTLGNTHTYLSDATPAANELRTRIIANAGGSQNASGSGVSTAGIEWHVGDLLIVSGTAPDNTVNGIYVYVGTTMTAVNTPTLESQRASGQSDQDLFTTLFRSLVNINNQGVPTLQNDGATGVSLSNVNVDKTDLEIKGNASTVLTNSPTQIQYNNSTDPVAGTAFNLSVPLSDNAGVTQFLSRMSIGGTSYIFGLEPPAPTMSYSPGNGVNQNLYRSSDITFAVPTTLTAPTGSFEGRPLAASDYAITMPAGDIDVTITGNSDSRALGTSRALPTISSISNAAAAIVTFASDPNLLVGQTFTVTGAVPAAYNATYTVVSIGAGNAITTDVDASAFGVRNLTVNTISQAVSSRVTFATAPGFAVGDTFTVTGSSEAAYNITYTVTSVPTANAVVTNVDTSAFAAFTGTASVTVAGSAATTVGTGARTTDGATISAVRASGTSITTTVTVDEPQTDSGAQVMTVTDNNVGFTPVSGFNYTDIVSGNPPLITYRDARTGPSISPTTVSRSAFDGAAQSVSIALRNTTSEITEGTGYHVSGAERRQGTSGAFGTLITGTNGSASDSINVNFNTARTYQYQFPMVTNPRNGQPSTNPATASIAFSFYTPFYLIASSGTPVLADITSATQVTAASWNNSLGSAYNNLLVSGAANDNIYLVVASGALTGSIATQVVGAPGNTPGTLLTAGNNISRPNNAGTAVVYNIYQFGSLIGTSVRVNLVRP